jgi:Ca2+-binding RTX toxin-like protein
MLASAIQVSPWWEVPAMSSRLALLTVAAMAAASLASSPVPDAALAEECDGQTATIVGTDGDDVLIGTLGPDVIVGLNGNDLLRGVGGDDLLCGNDGADRLRGGPGNDRLFGQEDGDESSEKYGDVLIGAAGDDLLDGGGT